VRRLITRTWARSHVAAGLLLVACGPGVTAPSRAELLTALRLGPSHQHSGFKHLADVVQKLDNGAPIRIVSAELALAELGRADVILLGEDHSWEACRRALLRTALLLRDCQRSAECTVFLESVCAEHQEQLSALRTAVDAQLREFMRRECPYPIDAYVEVLPQLWREGFQVRGARPYCDEALADPMLPDWARVPRARVADSHAEYLAQLRDSLRGPTLVDVNEEVVEEIDNWLGHAAMRSSRRRAIVLFGLGHVVGEAPTMSTLLARRGHRVAVLLPMWFPLERAIRERLPDAGDSWIELWDGVYRPPLVRDAEWIVESNRHAQRLAMGGV
jgi:hypothetical protein